MQRQADILLHSSSINFGCLIEFISDDKDIQETVQHDLTDEIMV